MMATVASLVVDVRANTIGYTRAINDAAKTHRGFLDSIQKIAGKRGAIGDIGDIFTGRGPIGGLSEFSQAIAESAKRAAELRKQLAEGEITASQFKSRLVEIVPIFGSFARIGREIGESLAMAFNPEIMRNMQRAAEMMKAGDARGKGFAQIAAMDRENFLMRLNPNQREFAEFNLKLQDAFKLIQENAGGLAMGPIMARVQQISRERAQAIGLRNQREIAAGNENWVKSLQERVKQIEDSAKGLSESQKIMAEAAQRGLQGTPLWPVVMRLAATVNNLDVAQKLKARQEDEVNRATGIFAQLRERNSAPVRFAGADISGSQSEFAGRQRALFASMNIDRKDEKELAKDAVRLAREQLKEQEQIKNLLKDAQAQVGVVNF